jgi:hypothetical protein
MERRKISDRRKVHMFFSHERRSGPFDRRNADARRRERAEEMQKIKEIRKFKEKETLSAPPAATYNLKRKQLIAVGLALVLLAIALFFI